MVHERLRFALEQLTSGDWQLFERFCSEFLVAEFPEIRTTATRSGDKGRDGELFSLTGVSETGFQYSVAADWNAKIRATVRTIADNELDYRRLIYCTSQQIGARSDELKRELWESHQLLLDVRDREWFCERELTTPEREVAAAELCKRIVDPITTARGIATAVGAPLSNDENRVALVQLALNASDRADDRSLTKTSFDALVQAALVGSSADTALDETTVIERVRKVAPHGGPNQVAELTRSALTRLTRKGGPVKHRTAEDTYHLSFEASQTWKASAAEYLLNQQSVEADLAEAARGYDRGLDSDPDLLTAEGVKLRAALEAVMLQSGEAFAAAIEGGAPRLLSKDVIADQLGSLELGLVLTHQDAATAILEVIASPSVRTRTHLVRVLDAYTLLAFLHQTPDVQKAMSRVFDNAQIWLDTSTVLPLLAETLISDPDQRLQTTLLDAATASGVRLHVTDGVIEELLSHMELCLAYLNRNEQWEGGPPYLYSAYVLSGRDERLLPDWLANVRGDMNPEQDIEEYLSHHYTITKRSLRELADSADAALRGAVQELFREKRSRRRRSENVVDRLTAHDVENVVGVIELRKGRRAPLGYEAWWLTLDGAAFGLRDWLRDQLGRDAPDSPVLSPDYFSQLLRLGPLRRASTAGNESLPLIVDVSRLEQIPVQLIEEARKTRAAFAGYDELRVQREVRDALTRLRGTLRKNHDYAGEISRDVASSIAKATR